MIPIIRVYLLVMCLLTTTWLTLQLRLYSSWLNNYPLLLTDTISCHLLLSSGIFPSMEQTIPSEISPCSKKNEQGCCISASRYHPWVTSSVDFQHCPFHLGDNSFSVSYNSWFFSPFCMISQETNNLTNVPSPYNCLNCRPGSFTARKLISGLEMKLALSISD